MSETYKVFSDKVNKIALSANDDKRIQLPHRIISYPYGTGPGIVCKVEPMRHPKMEKMKMAINFGEPTGENRQEHNPNWLQTPAHPCRILIIRGSGSGKANALLNLIFHQENDDFTHNSFYIKNPESKHQYLKKSVKRLV